jgi:hypothetical protein
MSRQKTSKLWLVPKEELEIIVKNHSSLADILRHFNMHAGAGNYHTLKSRIA